MDYRYRTTIREGIVQVMIDATQHYDMPLDAERLFNWHAALFPMGRSGMYKITVGAWRSVRRKYN